MLCPHCNHEFEPTDNFFQRCYEYITAKFPHLAPANTSLIHQWKEAGYSFEKHIKPAVDCVPKDKQCSFGYINAIIKNNITPVAKVIDKPRELTEAERAKNAAFLQRMGMHVG